MKMVKQNSQCNGNFRYEQKKMQGLAEDVSLDQGAPAADSDRPPNPKLLVLQEKWRV